MGRYGDAAELTRRAVFLDRDGTLNRAVVRDGRPFPPASLAELEMLPGVEQALEDLRGAGFMNIVITNQPDVVTGKLPLEAVEAIHAWMLEHLAIDEIRACYETEDQATGRYKPAPGMLLEAARAHGIDLARSHMIGDRWRDVGAGKAAGCFTYYLRNDYEERKPEGPDETVGSLVEAARIILTSIAREEINS